MCETDQQCDPGTFCVEGDCLGPDAGVSDAGPPPDAGSLTLTPASIALSGQVGRLPSPAQAELRNGTALLQTWTAACDGGAQLSPAQGESWASRRQTSMYGS